MRRWEPQDVEFAGDDAAGNPFAVEFSAVAEGPGGLRLEHAGFYAGDGRWTIRLAPPVAGDWALTTRSDQAALDGKRVQLTCTENDDPAAHGGLLIDPENPHHFVYEDGTRYFLSGYECDWLWALDEDALLPFLDTLQAAGFNHILLNAYAHDTGWRKGKTGPDDYGPPPMYAWEGSNDAPDFSRFNLDYWRHYDRVIQAMNARGIVAHIMVKVYNKMVNWPERYSAEEEQYFRWLAARYAAFPNVVWDFSKETYNEKDVEYKRSRFALIRALDPYKRLVTCHDDGKHYDQGEYDDLLDFESDQQHNHWHEVILKHRARRACPAVNVEYGYEHGLGGPEDMTYRVVQAPEEVLRRAWLVCMAGGYGAYYYTYTAWDVIRPEDTPPGYAYFRHMVDFFTDTGYWAVEPAGNLVEPGYCLARPGEEYIVYLDEERPFTLQIAGADGPLAAEWFNPLTGERQVADAVADGDVSFTPPWSEGPVALHVGTAPGVEAVERLSCTRSLPQTR